MSVTTIGFTARVTALTQAKIFCLNLQYLAIDDPRVKVQYKSITYWRDLGDVGKVSASNPPERYFRVVVPFKGKSFAITPSVAIFLNGALLANNAIVKVWSESTNA